MIGTLLNGRIGPYTAFCRAMRCCHRAIDIGCVGQPYRADHVLVRWIYNAVTIAAMGLYPLRADQEFFESAVASHAHILISAPPERWPLCAQNAPRYGLRLTAASHGLAEQRARYDVTLHLARAAVDCCGPCQHVDGVKFQLQRADLCRSMDAGVVGRNLQIGLASTLKKLRGCQLQEGKSLICRGAVDRGRRDHLIQCDHIVEVAKKTCV